MSANPKAPQWPRPVAGRTAEAPMFRLCATDVDGTHVWLSAPMPREVAEFHLREDMMNDPFRTISLEAVPSGQ